MNEDYPDQPEPPTTRYYDPTTGTEALDGIHDISQCTALEAMPEASRDWFTSEPIPEGKQWQTDPTGKFPILADIPPPIEADQKATQRQWARAELAATDSAMLPDSPYTDDEKAKLTTYRAALRNPAREAGTGFPADSWRPVFPEGIKRPGG